MHVKLNVLFLEIEINTNLAYKPHEEFGSRMSVLGGREVISMPGQGLEQKQTDDWIGIAFIADFNHS
jgi:hypothetical protein